MKTQITRSIVKIKAIQILEEIQEILRAYTYAFKHNSRTQIAESRYESNVTSADVDLKDTNINPFKLPMQKHLQVSSVLSLHLQRFSATSHTLLMFFSFFLYELCCDGVTLL